MQNGFLLTSNNKNIYFLDEIILRKSLITNYYNVCTKFISYFDT